MAEPVGTSEHDAEGVSTCGCRTGRVGISASNGRRIAQDASGRDRWRGPGDRTLRAHRGHILRSDSELLHLRHERRALEAETRRGAARTCGPATRPFVSRSTSRMWSRTASSKVSACGAGVGAICILASKGSSCRLAGAGLRYCAGFLPECHLAEDRESNRRNSCEAVGMD